jgi:hypothetical protein
MADKQINIQDEKQLIDLLLGTCDEEQTRQLNARLAAEPKLASAHAELAKVFDVLASDETTQAPSNLVSRTLEHIESQARLEALLAGQTGGKTAQTPVWRRVARSLAIAACLVLLVAAVVQMVFQQPTDNGNGPGVAGFGEPTPEPQRYISVPSQPENPNLPTMPEYGDGYVRVIGIQDPATGEIRGVILQPIDIDSQTTPENLNFDDLFPGTD